MRVLKVILRWCVPVCLIIALGGCFESSYSLISTSDTDQDRFGSGFHLAMEAESHDLNGTHWIWNATTRRYHRDGAEDSLALLKFEDRWVVEAQCPSCNYPDYVYYLMQETERNKFNIFAGSASELQSFIADLESKVRRGATNGAFDKGFYEVLRDEVTFSEELRVTAHFHTPMALLIAFKMPPSTGFGWTLRRADFVGAHVEVYPDQL